MCACTDMFQHASMHARDNVCMHVCGAKEVASSNNEEKYIYRSYVYTY